MLNEGKTVWRSMSFGSQVIMVLVVANPFFILPSENYLAAFFAAMFAISAVLLECYRYESKEQRKLMEEATQLLEISTRIIKSLTGQNDEANSENQEQPRSNNEVGTTDR